MAKVQIKIQKNHILVSFLPIKQQVVVSLHKLTPIQSYLLYFFLLTIFCISPIQRPRYFSSSYAYIKKRITIVFRAKANLSAPHHLTCFLNIETWKHSPIVLIPIFLADSPLCTYQNSNYSPATPLQLGQSTKSQSVLHFLSSKPHFESQYRGKYYFDILPERVVAIVVAVQAHFVWIDHVVVILGCNLLH